MTETLDLLHRRRSAKPLSMTGPGPDAATLDELLTIAVRVPDHGKLAPWRFIVFDGDGRERAGALFGRVLKAADPNVDPDRVGLEERRFQHAPLVIGVVSKIVPHPKVPEWEQILSAGAVCMNLLVAATAKGFAACWLTEWYAFDRHVLDGLGLGPAGAHRRLHSHRPRGRAGRQAAPQPR